MNPFLTRARGENWILPVSALSLVLGFMITLAWLPQSQIGGRIRQMDPDQIIRVSQGKFETELVQNNLRLNEEVTKLREEKTKLENSIGDRTNQSKILNESLQEAKLFAGLSAVEGPGILVTLKDSDKAMRGAIPEVDLIIHDTDVLRVVNELWAAGAEAIAVGKFRVASGTSIRCVGPTILVDNSQVSSPVQIRAIGDPDTLYGGVNMRGGVLDEIRGTGDTAMVQIERIELHRLPAYSGPTRLRHVKAGTCKPSRALRECMSQ
jgi:uncharacterized protein YlxW (UPF0749 family)